MNHNETDHIELIRILHEGQMLSHPGLKFHVDRALATGDFHQLHTFLDKHPVFFIQAKSNIQQDQYRRLDIPFPLIDHDDAHEYLSGPINLGYVNKHDDMFGMHPDELSMPTIIPGRVGGGKSNLSKRLILELRSSGSNANFIIPDLKLEYRHALRVGPDIKVFRKNDLKINPLQSPNWMGITEWIMFFAKLFTRQNWLLGNSENVLIEILEYIYRVRGIYDGSQDWPTFKDLYRVISKLAKTQKTFHFTDIFMVLQNRINPYIQSDVFNCKKGIPDKFWRTQNVILELDEEFTDNMYCFLVSYLVGLGYLYNKKHGLTGSKLRTLFVIDEGRILFNANRNVMDFGETYINEIITKTREYGIGFIIASQESDSFNQTLRSISYTKIATPLTDGKDLSFIKESFGLDEDQTNYLFKLPKHGVAVVRYGGYENPFLLSVPYTDLGPPVTDEEITQHMAPVVNQLRREIQETESNIKLPRKDPYPSIAITLLQFLNRKPFTKISDIPQASGLLSVSEVKKALSWLETNGFITRQPYKVSKRGRKAHFSVLTDKAYVEFEYKPVPGKGSFEHKLYQHLIYRKLQGSGLRARIEGRLGKSTKSMDVLSWDENGLAVAYEVTIHFNNLIGNIAQDLAAGAARVNVVCKDKADLAKARKIVESKTSLDDHTNSISFSLISDFFS